jgi:hypothetical protein
VHRCIKPFTLRGRKVESVLNFCCLHSSATFSPRRSLLRFEESATVLWIVLVCKMLNRIELFLLQGSPPASCLNIVFISV